MPSSTIKIPAELFALAESSRFEGAIDVPSLSAGPDDYVFEGPVEWMVEVTNTGAAFLVVGRAFATAQVACSRCLESVRYELEGDIEGYFLIEGEPVEEAFADEGDDLGADEFDVLPADHVIDIEPLVRAALIMDMPNMPLCSEGCAGLCPVCGSNLNEGNCGCGRDKSLEEFDGEANPFSALANFKFEE